VGRGALEGGSRVLSQKVQRTGENILVINISKKNAMFFVKVIQFVGCIILPSRPLKRTKFAIEINQKSMVAGALPRTLLGAHDAPRSHSGFAGTQVGRAIEKVGKP
jgi:hypothetical protein